MKTAMPTAVVAGHICLDIIPTFKTRLARPQEFYVPGDLLKIGAPVVATGGAVSNTGLALHRLGVPTRLMGKVGGDLFGRAITDIVRGVAPELAAGMIVAPRETSSYSVVLNPIGLDRMFLHCPGTNDTFGAADVAEKKLAGAKLFHFGYPPLMRRMYLDDGAELIRLFRRVKRAGLTTSLDMSMPDPRSEAGKVNWAKVLRGVLPFVDLFLPSRDEIELMLGKKMSLSALADQLRAWGAGTVGLKLGDQGFYLRTAQRELLAPCFAVEVAGATGAGDCTIAGFLAGWLRDLPLEETLTMAVAVGACCCEAPDATSGIQSWRATQQRIARGWKRRAVTLPLSGWRWDARQQLWLGPNDGGGSAA
jgi:sugar/nucleoside kinase (ribokinase family)